MQKVIVLFFGRPTPDAEPDGISVKKIKIESIRVLFGYIAITPRGKQTFFDEVNLPLLDGCLFYDGVFYSDIWVEDESENPNVEAEDFDPDKAKVSEDILKEYRLKEALGAIKGLDIDGETSQHILKEIGMDFQMLRQLIMSFPIKDVQALVDEKRGFEKGVENLTREQLFNRLSFIAADSKELGELLEAAKVDLEFSTTNAPIGTILSNIEIASDPTDREPEDEQWIPQKFYELGIDEGEEGTRTLKSFETKEEAEELKKELEDMFPAMKLFIDSCTYDYHRRG
jgi:hypothetical protein